MNKIEMVGRYQKLRNLGRELNSRLTQSLSRRNMMEGGRRLGIARGNSLVFDTEDETAMLMDYCIHDLRHDGQNGALSRQDVSSGLLRQFQRSEFNLHLKFS